jgi:hypothetical protein
LPLHSSCIFLFVPKFKAKLYPKSGFDGRIKSKQSGKANGEVFMAEILTTESGEADGEIMIAESEAQF